MIRRVMAGAVGAALALTGAVAGAVPAQAATPSLVDAQVLSQDEAAAQTISGRVAIGSNPVAGVGVRAYEAVEGGYAYGPAATKTDSDGRYTLAVDPGTYVIKVAKGTAGQEATKTSYSGGVTSMGKAKPVTVAAGAHVVENITPVRVVPAAKITGRLVDKAGNPVRGVRVDATAVIGTDAARWTTDADGRFTLGVKGKGAYELTFGRGYTTTIKTKAVRKSTNLDLGKVAIQRAGTSTVQVSFSGVMGEDNHTTPVHLKDSRGAYIAEDQVWDDPGSRDAVFRYLAAGTYEVYVPATRQSVKVTVGAGEKATTSLTLKKPAKTGTVKVVIGRFLKDQSFLDVELWSSSGLRVARADGWKFADVPTGTYTLRLAAADREYVRKVKVQAGRTTTVAVRPAGGQVSGKVRAGGKGYPGTVILKGVGTKARYERRADDSGRFVMGEIAPGRYRVIVRDLTHQGDRFTTGGYRDAYYKGKTLKKSKVITVKKGKTTTLSSITVK